MINSEKFSIRLQEVMDYYGETASSFSEKIGVQRSSISHILSGRNKPSLDFVMKILDSFPEIELYWLLNGKGSFPNSDSKSLDTRQSEIISAVKSSSDKTIEQIVIFYSDGTFRTYTKD